MSGQFRIASPGQPGIVEPVVSTELKLCTKCFTNPRVNYANCNHTWCRVCLSADAKARRQAAATPTTTENTSANAILTRLENELATEGTDATVYEVPMPTTPPIRKPRKVKIDE